MLQHGNRAKMGRSIEQDGRDCMRAAGFQLGAGDDKILFGTPGAAGLDFSRREI
jgi:hypothetical protein